MERAVFEVAVERLPLEAMSARGQDRVELRLSTNPGEEVKPLSRVASGGELSRTMLALKAVLARADRVPTLVFDEIDAGIGGAVAGVVADKLAQAAQGRQVLCVTHLAPIAARAGESANSCRAASPSADAIPGSSARPARRRKPASWKACSWPSWFAATRTATVGQPTRASS
jgi:predicted ATPase